jgi:hypothetical protein
MRRCHLPVVVVVIAACGCSSGGDDTNRSSTSGSRSSEPQTTTTVPSSSALAIHTDPSRTKRGRVPPGGSTWVNVRYPSAWYGDASATTLAVTSYPVHEPDEAIRALPSDGAFIFIIDYPAYSRATRRSPPRPTESHSEGSGTATCTAARYRTEFRGTASASQGDPPAEPTAASSSLDVDSPYPKGAPANRRLRGALGTVSRSGPTTP